MCNMVMPEQQCPYPWLQITSWQLWSKYHASDLSAEQWLNGCVKKTPTDYNFSQEPTEKDDIENINVKQWPMVVAKFRNGEQIKKRMRFFIIL